MRACLATSTRRRCLASSKSCDDVSARWASYCRFCLPHPSGPPGGQSESLGAKLYTIFLHPSARFCLFDASRLHSSLLTPHSSILLIVRLIFFLRLLDGSPTGRPTGEVEGRRHVPQEDVHAHHQPEEGPTADSGSPRKKTRHKRRMTNLRDT